MKNKNILTLCAAATLLALPFSALCATPNTLEKIRQTRTITIGHRSGARPFSYLN